MALRDFVVAITIILATGALVYGAIQLKHLKHAQHKGRKQPATAPLPPTSPVFAFDATVSWTRPGAYVRIMDAIASAPNYSTRRCYIHIEAGVYAENVYVWENKTNIALIGDGVQYTKITMNRSFPNFRTFETATVGVGVHANSIKRRSFNSINLWSSPPLVDVSKIIPTVGLVARFWMVINKMCSSDHATAISGAGFMAQYIAFENSAEAEHDQEVALMSTVDKSSFYRCIFLGFHDTLYAKQGRQFFRECDIYGSVDFIFGSAAAVFQNCNVYARAVNTIITAQEKGPSVIPSGFFFQNCLFTIAPELQSSKFMVQAYLGRPWSDLSTVIVMQSYLESIIVPSGWLAWLGRSTDTVTYCEYGNRGPGAITNQRVSWLGYRVLNSSTDVLQFTAANFIAGDSWIPETGIPYVSGLL